MKMPQEYKLPPDYNPFMHLMQDPTAPEAPATPVPIIHHHLYPYPVQSHPVPLHLHQYMHPLQQQQQQQLQQQQEVEQLQLRLHRELKDQHQEELKVQQHQQQHLQPLSNPNATPTYEMTASTPTATAGGGGGGGHAGAHASGRDSAHGSAHADVHGSTHGSAHGSDHGSTHGSVHSSAHGSVHGSAHSSCVVGPSSGMHSHGSLKMEQLYLDYEMADMHRSTSRRSYASSTSRKRKSSSYSSSSGFDMDGTDSSSTFSSLNERKQNHSEIEKRRRDKMNTYISELSSMIPMCGAAARKLDKLTVLRMAVQHLRAVRGSQSAGPLARARPAYVSERDLNALVLQAAGDAFLFVVSCDRGRLLYVSHSVKAMLHYDQEDLHEHSIFDILHPKDVAKMKEQLSSSELGPRERFIDIKTMLPVKSDLTVTSAQRLCHGVRRSFFCRIKTKQPMERSVPKVEKDSTTKTKKKAEKKYCVVQCTGYLKAWAATDLDRGRASGEEEACTMSCLVAVARCLPVRAQTHDAARASHYVSRHAIDGKFLFVDQRVTLALGFLPQELLGTSLYEYVSGPALGALARSHKQALLRRDAQLTPPYSFRRKDGSYATIQTHFKPFRNPWTKDVECLVANNSVVADAADADDVAQNYEAFRQTDEWRNYLSDVQGRANEEESCDDSDVRAGLARHAAAVAAAACRAGAGAGAAPARARCAGAGSSAGPSGSGSGSGSGEMQRMIESHVEVHKIGSTIAEEVMRQTAEAAMQQDPIFSPSSLAESILSGPPEAGAGGAGGAGVAAGAGGAGVAATGLPALALDGNSEAAMAVIMSLLEADAGLGGPVNFSGLPWPLP